MRLLALVLSALLRPASGEVPLPIFAECGDTPSPALCPSDLDQSWYLLSSIPEVSQDTLRPAERSLGSGNWADRAWTVSTGRWDVTIAVADSGIQWHESDLIHKIRLNTAELPLPQTADGVEVPGGDLDGNGLVNVADYAEDPRVRIDAGVDTADDVLDPSDLIYTFSDGVDDDSNGYTDDIAGWDFFDGDNDPWNTYDDGYGTHGTGVMEDAAAEGENGGTIGVCASCSVLPIRVGDTFITDGTRVAMAVAYATDAGARVLGMAIGSLSAPEDVYDALEYAHSHDVVVISAAGDENAYHHNLPAMIGDVLYVHSVRTDTADSDDAAYSYLNFLNCNNYGPRVDLVAGADACATGAVALISGVAGLALSTAWDQGDDLDADELRQVLIQSVDDVWLTPEEVEEARTYPSSEGWDPFYGYGRSNAWYAVSDVAAGRVPPVARLTTPQWFALFDPQDHPSVELRFDARAPRSSGYTWSLEWGQGWEPTRWTAVDSGDGSAALDGHTVQFDPSGVALEPMPEPPLEEGVLGRVERVHQPLVTVRLTVTDAEGLSAESRRSFWIYKDGQRKPGFPFDLQGSGEPSPILVDLDGDGVLEILVASSSGRVWALNGRAEVLDGWPVDTDTSPRFAWPEAAAYASGALELPQDGVLASPAAADLDGDGGVEVVVATLGGQVYAWGADGTLRPGFPVRILGRTRAELDREHVWDNGIVGAPTLADLDADGGLDILVAGMDGRVYAWDADGQPVGPYPIELCHPENCGVRGSRIITSTTVGDMDGDGDLDVAVGSNETVRDGRDSVSYLFDAATGEALPGWPRAESGLVAVAALLPIIGEGKPATAAAVDLDGDGELELLDPVMLGQSGVRDHLGEEVLELPYTLDQYGAGTNSNEPSFVSLTNNPAIGDLNLDGTPDLFLGGAGTYAVVGLALTTAVDFQHVLGGWDGRTGRFLPGWPRQVEDFQFLVAPAIADLSGDGYPEVIYASAGSVVHAWDVDGDSPAGWPKFTGQWLLGSPAVGDIDGDGYVDVVTTTREGLLFAWTSAGRADQAVQWASIHHDARNTGNYEVALPVQAGPPPEECEGRGCCCREGRGEQAALLLPLGLLALRRRRAVRG